MYEPEFYYVTNLKKLENFKLYLLGFIHNIKSIS
jgi:hypothetical protein